MSIGRRWPKCGLCAVQGLSQYLQMPVAYRWLQATPPRRRRLVKSSRQGRSISASGVGRQIAASAFLFGPFHVESHCAVARYLSAPCSVPRIITPVSRPVSLIAGTRIGSYEIAAQIGVGGKGEVYRATDTNLKRQVAIKVLPEAVAADAERLARFQR